MRTAKPPTQTKPKPRLTPLLIAGLSAAILLTATPALKCEEAKGNSATNSPASQSTGSQSKPSVKKELAKAPPHALTGAELYSMHCNRCHPERYPTERTAAQWKTILLHMRVRANLPAEHARTILKYLQDNSGR
jgi:hypothetical protein